MSSRIIATAAKAPDQVITNDDLAKIVDTSDEWIVQRTGIRSRHISNGENTSVFVIDVAKQLIEKASVNAEDIDLIIVASVTPDYGTPSLACMVQKEIHAINAVAFDITAACTGFIFALNTADMYIRSGMYKNAIVIGGETLSKIVDWSDRSTCVLFGDGAGGAYIEASEQGGIVSRKIGSDGSLYDILTEGYLECTNPFSTVKEQRIHPKYYVSMDGREVFKFATKKVISSIQELLDKEGLTGNDIRYIVPHQANIRIVEVISKKLKIPMDKFYINMESYGNTSSASVPIALNELNEKGLIERGDKIVLAGFGGGMTWGVMIVEW